jgi:type VI secretion system secreted protein Hcp
VGGVARSTSALEFNPLDRRHGNRRVSMAAIDFFLKLDGIDGEAQDDKHKNEIEIMSFNWGAANVGSGNVGTGSGTGKVSVQDLTISKYMDKSSVPLFVACCTGKHIPTLTLTARRAGGEKQVEYCIIKATEVYVSAFNNSGSDPNMLAQESVSFNFAKIELKYTPQKEDGSAAAAINGGWDIKINKKV